MGRTSGANKTSESLICEHEFEYERLTALMEWLTSIDDESELGVFWINNGANKEFIFEAWIRQHHDPRHMKITIPSECGTSELLYQILRAIQASPENNVNLLDLINVSYEKRIELRYGTIPFPWPRETSERRQALERIYEQQEDLYQIKVVLDDAENLLPKALKEVVYLNKILRCPFILMGNEDLWDLVMGAKSNRIKVFPQSGEEFDPEFIAQAKQYFGISN